MIASNQGRVEVASPCHVYGTSVLSDADAAWLGTRAKIVTAGPKTLQGKEAAISAAGAQVGYYTKTAAIASATALPETGYAHKIGGQRKYDSTWNVYTTQPDSPTWQAYHVNELMKLPAWVQTVFSDSLLLSYTQGGKAAKPPGFTKIYTVNEWLTLLAHNIDGWASVIKKPFIVNGLTQNTINNLTPGVGMIENAFGSQLGTLPTAANWLAEVSFLQLAQASGWTPWVYVKLRDGVSWDAWRRLIVPTMLLVDSGSLLFELGGVEGSDQPWVTKEYDHPLYQPNIGLPVNTMYAADLGVYRRDFENGFVIVNPTTLAYNSPEGVTVGPQTGGAWRKREVTTTVYDAV